MGLEHAWTAPVGSEGWCYNPYSLGEIRAKESVAFDADVLSHCSSDSSCGQSTQSSGEELSRPGTPVALPEPPTPRDNDLTAPPKHSVKRSIKMERFASLHDLSIRIPSSDYPPNTRIYRNEPYSFIYSVKLLEIC